MDSVEGATNGPEYKNDPGNRSGTVTLETFKLVAADALEEHDELRKRYEEQQAKLEEVQAQLTFTEESLLKLSSVSEQACEEMVNLHQDMETKIDVEQRCREEAESYASKMVKDNKHLIRENKEIKRKSMAILGKAGMDINLFEMSLDVIPDEGESASPDETSTETSNAEQKILIEELQYQIKDLNFKLTQTQNELEKVRQEKEKFLERATHHKEEASRVIEQLALESTSHEITKAALKEREKTLEKLNRVSTLVIQEYQDVSTKYEEETVLRETAEQFAAKMYSERQAADEARRRSLLMLDEAVDDSERIAKLLEDVKNLTQTIEEDRQNHKKELEEAEERIKASEDLSKQESLEQKLQLAGEEMTVAEKRISDLEQTNKKLEKEVEDLKEAAKPAPPPAPPPPPPPPVAKNPLSFLQTILSRRGTGGPGGSSKNQAKKDPTQEQYQATMEEMMKRIKKGGCLRPVGQQPASQAPEKHESRGIQAVQELDNILQSIKKNHTGKFTAIPPNQRGASENLSEFDKIMRKRREKSLSIKAPSSKAANGPAETNGSAEEPTAPPSIEEPTPSPTQDLTKDELEKKKNPVPAPRASVRTSSSLYQEVQPVPREKSESSTTPTAKDGDLYDSIPGGDEKPAETKDPLQALDPDDSSNLYSVVKN